MKKIVTVLLVMTLAAALFADQVGEISYLADRASITRNGKDLRADFGSPVENYDSIRTADKGLVEIAIFPETGIDGTIRVKPNSTLFLEITSLRSEQKGSVELLSGSVAVAVKKLSGKSKFEIRGQGVVMGVRGTSFEVTTSPAGDILVTCETGRVVCEDESGRSLFAEPGSVVERTAEGDFRNIPVRVSSLEEFRRNWNAEKIEALKSNANRAVRDYAARYMDLKRQFDEAYRGLLMKRDVLDKWFREEARGTTGSTIEVMREKTALMEPLMALRRVSFLFERVYYRLLELEGYHREGHGRGPLGNGMTSDQFFRRMQNEAQDLQERTNIVRYAMKLYAKRNDGVSLFDDLLGGAASSDSSVSEEESFFGR